MTQRSQKESDGTLLSNGGTVTLVIGDPKHVVETGYDLIAGGYLDWADRIDDAPRMRFLDASLARLRAPAAVLDLGCGSGIPCTAALAEYHDVLGVDISAGQLELARRMVPRARFRKAHMTALRFPPDGFDAVTAFYSIAHVPRQEHAALYNRITLWLRPGGLFLAALACDSADGVEDNWLGAPMYFSSHDPATNRELLQQAGLTLLVDEQVTIQEPEGPATFQWVIAQRERRAEPVQTNASPHCPAPAETPATPLSSSS